MKILKLVKQNGFKQENNFVGSSLISCSLTQSKRALAKVLWLVALHSFSMGIGLIVQPDSLLNFMGFSPVCENFFPAQGGAFHVLMGIAYLMGACNVEKYHSLIVFSIIVKSGAALFLTLYCIIAGFKWFILFCAVIDTVMSLTIFLFFCNYFRSKNLPKSKTHG